MLKKPVRKANAPAQEPVLPKNTMAPVRPVASQLRDPKPSVGLVNPIQSVESEPINPSNGKTSTTQTTLHPPCGLDEFDEAYYTSRYHDVADSITAGVWHNGLMHYAISGRASNRIASQKVDEAWYESVYPMATQDIEAGRATTFSDHYYRIGRYRGYLSSFRASRMEDAAKCRSRYGGLWTDHGNAMDLIEGRLDLGKITPSEAELLRHWVTNGYVIIPQGVSDELLAPALEDLNRAYDGAMPEMRYDIHGLGRTIPWAPQAQTNPSKALDLHWHSDAVRNMMFAPPLLAFLHLIFERRVLATQSLGFWRGSQQNGHQDSAYVNYSLPMQFAASWVALEDVKEGAGELFYHVGSHRIGEYRFHDRFKGVSEARRLGFSDVHTEGQIGQHVNRIADQSKGLGLRTDRFKAKRGDVLIWSADLVHGGSPISTSFTRKSIVTHYCPADSAPSFFERGKSKTFGHQNESYASGYYKTQNDRNSATEI